MRRTSFLWLIPMAVFSLTACGGEGGQTPSGDCAVADDGSQCQVENQLGFCVTGSCAVSTCGDGFVDESAGEDCDDANTDDTDGCTADCLFTCEADADCHDGQVCNGAETCDAATHTCVAGSAAADGTVCTVEGDTSDHACSGGLCISNTCGDGFVGGGEACDDGNDTAGDGCEPDCTWTCSAAVHCDDGNPCNGFEGCEAHVCVAGTPLQEGAECDTGKECLAGVCTTADCGDGTLNNGEDCDDGNTVADDGCEPDCTWTCEVDADCDDATVCTGLETCVDHVCTAGEPLACDDHDACTADSCDALDGCVFEPIDADGDGVVCGVDCDEADKSVRGPKTWYKDCDDDGYAPNSSGSQVGCAEPQPSSGTCLGWTDRDPAPAADCDDGHPDVHPDAGYQTVPFSEPYLCGPGKLCTRDNWDYDCDGLVEKHYTLTGVSPTAACSAVDIGGGVLICSGDFGWTSTLSAPPCGEIAEYTGCAGLGVFSCANARLVEDRAQGCR